MEIFKLIQTLDNDVNSKLSRLLILIYELVSGDNDKKIEGISKLAKLDFLLASPSLLKRIIKKPGAIKKITIPDYEIDSIENSLNFYRYNPWDENYRRLLNILIAKNLVSIKIENKSYYILITPRGTEIVNDLYKDKSFEEFKIRAKLLRTYLGNYSDSYLRMYFQKEFPELSNLNQNENIF